MDDHAIFKLDGDAVGVFCDLNPTYEAYVTIQGKKKVLSMRLVKALDGCAKRALLWYELYTNTLKDMGFELNPYDLCVASKMIDGKQCTIVWWVDDNKISHVSPHVVEEIISATEANFGKMVVTRGDTHTLLGMHIYFHGSRQCTFTRKNVGIRETIEVFGEPMDRNAATPALRGLLELDDSAILPEKIKLTFLCPLL